MYVHVFLKSISFVYKNCKIQATSGYLDHVFQIFNRLGYASGDKDSKWDVIWHHDYPFVDDEMRPILLNLLPHQKVCHFDKKGLKSNFLN